MTGTATLDPSLFLPDPEPRPVFATVISVDDHVVEPAHLFEGRIPAALTDRAPRIVETPEGHQVWEFEGERYTQVGMNAVAGRRPETTGSSRSASTRCVPAATTSTPGSGTWTSTGCGRRSTPPTSNFGSGR